MALDLLHTSSTFAHFDFLVQVLEDEPFEALRPTLDTLISDKEPDKQRALAEFIAGLIGGNRPSLFSIPFHSILVDRFQALATVQTACTLAMVPAYYGRYLQPKVED